MRVRTPVLAAFALGLCTLQLLGQAQPAAATTPTIHYSFPNVSIEIARSTSLQSVLQEFCRQTGADCTGLDQTAGSSVAPSTLRGTWSEVLNQLMEGTALNYAAGPPSRSQGGRLVIQGQRVTLPPPSSVPAPDFTSSNNVAAAPAMAAPATGSAGAEDAKPSEDPAAGSGMSAGAASGALGGARMGGVSSGPMPGTVGSPLTSEMPANTSSNEPLYFPFPDGHGNPIPLSNQPIQYLPFPDGQGNLIPVKQGEPGGSPFPDWAILQAQHKH